MLDLEVCELENEIVEDLKAELENEPEFNEKVLKAKVKSAIREVVMKRSYKDTSYTNDEITLDLYNYYSVIRSVALYDYNQRGAEYETQHSENGVNRTWESRDALFKGVHAFVKVF